MEAIKRRGGAERETRREDLKTQFKVRIPDPSVMTWYGTERPTVEREIVLHTIDVPVPKLWQEALAAIHAYDPNAFLVGGALRDLVHGCPEQAKDLDIFTTADFAEWRKAFPNLTVPYEYDNYQFIPMAFATLSNGLEVHINSMKETLPEAIALAIDSLGQIAFDGKAIWVTPLFLKDLQEKQVHILEGSKLTGQSTWRKIHSLLGREPYSDFTVVRFDA